MAAFRCAIFIPQPLYFTGKRVSLKVIRCSSLSIPPLSSKSTNRKNYLRRKILRTLNPKPQETVLTPEIIPPPIDISSNQEGDVVEEELQVLNSSVVVSNEVRNGIFGKLTPKLIVKYGLCLVGIFAFQTICAVLFLGKGPENSVKSVNGNVEGRVSNVMLIEGFEMSEKIAEIRAMAREARKSEEMSSKNEDDEETLMNPGGGIDIEKEIEARLSNMEKRLNSQRKGLAGLRVDLKDDKSLMFDKKYKFKAEKPPKGNVKGFGTSNGNVRDSENGEENPEEEQKEAETNAGTGQESEQMRPSTEVNKSRTSGNQAGSGFGKTLLSGKNKGKPMRRAMVKENNMWWLKLPYVLRILMRSNVDQEITEGYFTMRTESTEENEGQVSHMIAFEDQSDARNFSYLLESVFEDLDDFSADVVPISTKDLDNELSSSDDKNVIVVKKRQLTLYAGQPFEDVETSLRNIIQGTMM